MLKVQLIHWNAAEAQQKLEALRDAGFDALWDSLQGAEALRRFDIAQPDVFVIDLSRLPSSGREVGVFLRTRKATRLVPLVFVGGEPQKVERVRGLLPDAAYCAWDDIAATIRQAISTIPAVPAKPNTMDAYRGRSLADKLGIKAGSDVLLIGAPEGFSLGPLPEGVKVLDRGSGAGRVLLFVRSLKDLDRRFAKAGERTKEDNGLWVVWPKKTSGIRTDLSEGAVRAYGLNSGWVDYKICAVNETWSGLQFARRDRASTRAAARN